MTIRGGAAEVGGHDPASSASDPLDRSPYRHIPQPFRERCEAWLSSARNLVSGSDPFRYMSVENLMFAERPILEMEMKLAREKGSPPVLNEPWLLMECSASSILWLFGLYEVSRGMKEAIHPRFPALVELHRKLEVLRMPLAKHEVKRQRRTSHYPTSIWCPETGRVGWQVYDPDAGSNAQYDRTQLADEFLNCTGGLSVSSQEPKEE
jgi:hypothetical protein